MSVLIKGMEMPTSCENCELAKHFDGYNENDCPFNAFSFYDCPLVVLPGHGDLMDKDELSMLVGESFDYFLARLGLKCPKPIIPADKSEEECENEKWYTELDDPKFGEWSEDGQT